MYALGQAADVEEFLVERDRACRFLNGFPKSMKGERGCRRRDVFVREEDDRAPAVQRPVGRRSRTGAQRDQVRRIREGDRQTHKRRAPTCHNVRISGLTIITGATNKRCASLMRVARVACASTGGTVSGRLLEGFHQADSGSTEPEGRVQGRIIATGCRGGDENSWLSLEGSEPATHLALMHPGWRRRRDPRT